MSIVLIVSLIAVALCFTLFTLVQEKGPAPQPATGHLETAYTSLSHLKSVEELKEKASDRGEDVKTLQMGCMYTLDDDSFLQSEAEQRGQVMHFKRNSESFGYDKMSGKLAVFLSTQYKLAGKPVPKIGSTFLIQMFRILNQKANENVFKEPRMTLHHTTHKRNISQQTIQNYTLLIMARNPYSRLFSGYVDKVYLPNDLGLSRHIYSVAKSEGLASGSFCDFNNTFDKFLNYVFTDNITHIAMPHYGPVLTDDKCKQFCQVQNLVIVKQESFSNDIEYALRLTGVEKEKYDTIYSALHGKNVQSNIPGIVKTVYKKMLGNHISRHCLSWDKIAERLWKSFQIQGYISAHLDFPHEQYTSKTMYKNANYLTDLILKKVKKHPLTHEQKLKQRRDAMLSAYAAVSEELKLKIQKQYALDFSFYDYSKDL